MAIQNHKAKTEHLSETGSVIAINAKLLMATVQGIVAWSIWPTSLEWYGLGLFSILLGLSALGLVIAACREIILLHLRHRKLKHQTDGAEEQKTAPAVSKEVLRNSGMMR